MGVIDRRHVIKGEQDSGQKLDENQSRDDSSSRL